MKTILFLLTTFLAAGAWADDTTVEQLNFQYRAKGAGPFSAEAGRAMFEREYATKGEQRSCTSCHTSDLRAKGKQANTGKPIEPLAPSANRERLVRTAEVEKWFNRNCKWTLGRACSPQEKGDFIAYIVTQ